MSPVTALSLDAGNLYVGSADGAVRRMQDGRASQTWQGPAGIPVSLIAASPYGLAWLSGEGGAIRDRLAPNAAHPETLCLYDAEQNRISTIRLEGKSPIRRLAWVQGRVAVCGDFGAAFFDAKGRTVAPEAFLPREAAEALPQSSLWAREQADGTELVVFAKPYSVRQDPQNQDDPLVSLLTAYQVGAWQWVKLGGFATTAFHAFPQGELTASPDGRIVSAPQFVVLSDRIALAENGVVAREPGSLVQAPLYTPNWALKRGPASPAPGDALWFGAGGEAAWWWNGTALVRQDRSTGESSAFLPWAHGEFAPTAFAADGTGVWVGSVRGLVHLDPSAAEYGYFVRVRFGAEANSTAELTQAVFAWRFAGADRAGDDGGRMVASAFSAVGLSLPTTARELQTAGSPVRGDLRFGDVLATPKSAAIYLGDGITVELRDGKVQNGQLWGWRGAALRRVLK